MALFLLFSTLLVASATPTTFDVCTKSSHITRPKVN
jgi:hypothetical protein